MSGVVRPASAEVEPAPLRIQASRGGAPLSVGDI